MPEGPFDGRVVCDLTYGAGEPPLLREARRAGCLALDGLPMLVAQAERQFHWWTGCRPEPGVMRRAALASSGPTGTSHAGGNSHKSALRRRGSAAHEDE